MSVSTRSKTMLRDRPAQSGAGVKTKSTQENLAGHSTCCATPAPPAIATVGWVSSPCPRSASRHEGTTDSRSLTTTPMEHDRETSMCRTLTAGHNARALATVVVTSCSTSTSEQSAISRSCSSQSDKYVSSPS